MPDVIDGIIVLKGAEANILDYEGSLDVKPSHLEKLGWVIASYHDVTCPHASIADHTAGWIAVAKNPLVDVIGHCGDERFRFDYEAGVQAFAKYGKIVEINAHSLIAGREHRKTAGKLHCSARNTGFRWSVRLTRISSPTLVKRKLRRRCFVRSIFQRSSS